MLMPHVVTIYNVVTETDPETFEDVSTNYITVLSGVLLDATKGTNVIKSGLEGADAVTLHIPFDVKAVDGATGAEKRYVGPMEFWRAEDKSGIWTLSTDRNTFFVKGDVIEDDWQAFSPEDYDGVLSADGYLMVVDRNVRATEEFINMMHDNVYTVTKVDEKDFGLPTMQHWEVGGR